MKKKFYVSLALLVATVVCYNAVQNASINIGSGFLEDDQVALMNADVIVTGLGLIEATLPPATEEPAEDVTEETPEEQALEPAEESAVEEPPSEEAPAEPAESIENSISVVTLSASNGSNFDYAGRPIFTDSQLATIAQYRPTYEAAADQVGIPWQVLAVLHMRENNLELNNPSNGEGVYQLTSYTSSGSNSNAFYPAGAISSSEFMRQSVLAAQIIKQKEPALAPGCADDTVKRAFFRYNGTAGAYKTQAINLGFGQAGAEIGEGSPYVMNKADASRDPEVNGGSWGQYISGRLTYPAVNNYGAFVQYKALC